MDRKINFRRWCDVILLGLVSYALVYLIASVGAVQVAFGKWANFFSSLHIFPHVLLWLVGFCMVLSLLKYFNVLHIKHLRNPCLLAFHPPITCSIVLCLILLSLHLELTQFLSNSFLVNYLLVSGVLVFVLVVGLYVWHLCNRKKNEVELFDEEIIDIPKWIQDENQKAHYRWLMSEKPIKGVDEDWFERDSYVERISNLFEPRNRGVHVAIVGPFGIGKTSLWKCVADRLGKGFIFVSVDGWARSEKTAAAQIIDEMIDELSNYVDCASIRDVPKEYMDALAGIDFQGASLLSKILSLHNHQSPRELIGKIDAILKSIGKRMVVVLEDFDRNPNADNSMNDVAGLLDRLRHFSSISFIVCLAPGVPSHILSRVSLHREDLLSFDAKSLVESTIGLMEVCVKRNDPGSSWSGSVPIQTDEFFRAMSRVIKTPRDAKYALRRALNAWEKGLDGEVDMYDLMAVNVLRYCAPEAFDFMVEKYDQLREGVTDVDASRGDVLAGRAIDLFSKAGVDELNARSLIKILWPSWHAADGVPHGFNVQRVAGRLGRVYLERIITEKISPRHKEETDLEFFGGIYGGERPYDEMFMNKLCGSEYWSEKFIVLVGYSCQNNQGVESISQLFIDFMVRSCRDGKDIFFNNLPNVTSTDITFIVSKVGEKIKEDVFALFIRKMRDEPEKLFSQLTISSYGAYPNQERLWIEHKEGLERCLSQATSLSIEAKLEAEALVRELGQGVG